MVRTLYGRIVVLPSKTPNGDYVPGVVETHHVRGENTSRREVNYPLRYSFFPENLGPDLLDDFSEGKIKTPAAVSVTVEDSPGVYNKVIRAGIRRR